MTSSIDGPLYPLLSRCFAAWMLIGTYYASERFAGAAAETGHLCAVFRTVLVGTLARSLVWTVVTVVLFRYSAQFRLSASRATLVLAHAPAAIGAALVVVTTDFALGIWVAGPRTFHEAVVGGFHRALLDAVIVLGLAYALRTYEQSRAATIRSATLETQVTQAQLQALQSQLQPHFLFNTLHSITALLRQSPDRAERMIVLLSDLLRRSMVATERPQIRLGDELGFVNRYLEIQQLRFSDRIRVQLHIEPRTQSLLVPPFILQPLVENSFKHALGRSEEGGDLEIEAHLENETLVLQVTDSGPGRGASADESPLGGRGIGNVRSRLRGLYGDAFALQLERRPAGGTRVTLRLPAAEETASPRDRAASW